jgi:DNA-binding Xre family transcriptional regulator
MPVVNNIKSMCAAQGITTAYQFWQKSGLPQTTANRLYRDPTLWPSKANADTICATLGVQPGDFLEFVPSRNDIQ